MTTSRNNRPEPLQTSAREHQHLTPGFAGRLSPQSQVAVPGSFGVELPLLASQRAAADMYRHQYQTPDSEAGKSAASAKPDQSAKPAEAAVQADFSRDKKVHLKRKKVNANRFRARPNKPTNWAE